MDLPACTSQDCERGESCASASCIGSRGGWQALRTCVMQRLPFDVKGQHNIGVYQLLGNDRGILTGFEKKHGMRIMLETQSEDEKKQLDKYYQYGLTTFVLILLALYVHGCAALVW